MTNAIDTRRLPWLIASNSANSVFAFLTVFGTVFILFLDKLGLPKGHIGLILSLFPFCGILALFIAPAVARFGFKRTYVTFWGFRKVACALLLLTPTVIARYGSEAAFIFVAGAILLLAVCRAVGETGYYPWLQEIVPDRIRGKFLAVTSISTGLASMVTIVTSAYFIKRSDDLNVFISLMGVGVVFGFISVFFASLAPSGNSRGEALEGRHYRGMLEALHDRNFTRYLLGEAIIILSAGVAVFLPLYMKNEIGLTSGSVVLLPIASLVGGITTGYLWGWASDRYGSKPVLLTCLSASAIFSACWLIVPRHSPWSFTACAAVTLVTGMFASGLHMSDQRLLYVNVVPAERKTLYMPLYYSWIGIVGGLSPLIAGQVLNYTGGISTRLGPIHIDGYTPLLVAVPLLMLLGLFFLRRVHAEGDIPAARFAGMFVRGNPLAAAESLVRYRHATKEIDRVSLTERMGAARSPLTVDELLEATADPSFNVRYEAIIAISRADHNPRLTEALIRALDDEPAIASVACWALGRLGDPQAIPALRRAMSAPYPLLRTTSIRSLGALGDTETIPVLMQRLREESDIWLRLAYASALGRMHVAEVTPDIMRLLREVETDTARCELVQAVARMVGEEKHFINLWRGLKSDSSMAADRALRSLKHSLRRRYWAGPEIVRAVTRGREALAVGDLVSGVAEIITAIRAIPPEQLQGMQGIVLCECAERLEEYGDTRPEYMLLALHYLLVAAQRG